MATTRLEDLVDDDRITAVGMLAEAYAALGQSLGREMETEGGIALTWYGVLVRLGRSPGGQLRMSDLAAAVALTTSGTTRLVDRIEAAGLIERRACAEDRRVAYAALTSAGRELLARTTPLHIAGIERHLVAALTPAELNRLVDLLRKVRDHNLPGAGRACG